MKYRKRTNRIKIFSSRVNQKTLILKSVLVIFYFLGSGSHIFAHDQHDLENWHVFILDKNVSGDAHVAFSQEIKYRDYVSDFYLSRSDIAYHHKVSSAIVLSACYKVIHIKRDAGWINASIPYINGLFTWSLGGLSVKHRVRFEYWIPNYRDEFWRTRHLLTVETRHKWTHYQLKPYIAHETFYDLDEKFVSFYRKYVGISFSPFKSSNVSLYYLLQDKNVPPGWDNYHVIGTTIKYSF